MARSFARWSGAGTLVGCLIAAAAFSAQHVSAQVADSRAKEATVASGPSADRDAAARLAVDASRRQATWADAFRIASLTNVPPQLSSECRVREPSFVGRAPLRRLRRAIIEKRPPRVLALGSSSTVGIGASSPLAAYPLRLENDLETYLKGVDIQMITRGVGGENALDASERIKLEVADQRPDLLVWQVGTNDAMAHLDEAKFREALRSTLRWLAKSKIDVVLIDPQYTDRVAKDDYYRSIVAAIEQIALEERVLLVRRFEAMAEISRNKTFNLVSGDGLHLNDLGYRCMAEYAARAIVAGILAAEPDAVADPPVKVPQ